MGREWWQKCLRPHNRGNIPGQVNVSFAHVQHPYRALVVGLFDVYVFLVCVAPSALPATYPLLLMAAVTLTVAVVMITVRG